jgi:hypothetical protein
VRQATQVLFGPQKGVVAFAVQSAFAVHTTHAPFGPHFGVAEW